MRSLFAFTSLLLLIGSRSSGQKPYSVSGELRDCKKPFKVRLQYYSGKKEVNDSTLTKNGKFSFHGTIGEPLKATLVLEPANGKTDPTDIWGDDQAFFLEAGKTTVLGKDVMADADIRGGKTQEEYRVLLSRTKPFRDGMKPLQLKIQDAFKRKDEAAQKAIFPGLRSFRLQIDSTEMAFIPAYPDSYVSLDLVGDRSHVIDPKTFSPLYNALSERMRNTEAGTDMGKKLAISARVDIGQPFVNFTLNNTQGEPITLSSLKGRYLLVDFWASWCGPCRAENPNVLKAYNQFHSKNFDVVAISLDSDKDKWVKAIAEDHMPWLHLSDLKAWNSPVALEYDIRAIPQNFLLDPEGKIIARNLRGEDLESKLKELLKD